MNIPIISMYVKVVGTGGEKIHVQNYAEYVIAIKKLLVLNKPLTFAFELPFEHHCTISYIFKCKNPRFYDESKKFFQTIQTNPISSLRVVKKDIFSNKDVFILSIENNIVYNAFQAMSQVGIKEGATHVRIPHMTWFSDSTEDKAEFIKSILVTIN